MDSVGYWQRSTANRKITYLNETFMNHHIWSTPLSLLILIHIHIFIHTYMYNITTIYRYAYSKIYTYIHHVMLQHTLYIYIHYIKYNISYQLAHIIYYIHIHINICSLYPYEYICKMIKCKHKYTNSTWSYIYMQLNEWYIFKHNMTSNDNYNTIFYSIHLFILHCTWL